MAVDPQFEARKAAIKEALGSILHGRTEIGLKHVQRDLAYALNIESLVNNGHFIAKMLNAVGWRRDGWLGTGYDREARYVPQVRM